MVMKSIIVLIASICNLLAALAGDESGRREDVVADKEYVVASSYCNELNASIIGQNYDLACVNGIESFCMNENI